MKSRQQKAFERRIRKMCKYQSKTDFTGQFRPMSFWQRLKYAIRTI